MKDEGGRQEAESGERFSRHVLRHGRPVGKTHGWRKPNPLKQVGLEAGQDEYERSAAFFVFTVQGI